MKIYDIRCHIDGLETLLIVTEDKPTALNVAMSFFANAPVLMGIVAVVWENGNIVSHGHFSNMQSIADHLEKL